MSGTPVLNQFSLVVSDMEATVAFYRRLGLTIPDHDPAWPNNHRSATTPGGIDLDFDTVEFARVWDQGWTAPAGGGMGVLGFGVESREAVDALYADMTSAGYPGQQPPYDAFWGARYAILSDPDGNAVGIMSPISPDRRGPLPEHGA